MSGDNENLDKWIAETRSYVDDAQRALDKVNGQLDKLEEAEPPPVEPPPQPETLGPRGLWLKANEDQKTGYPPKRFWDDAEKTPEVRGVAVILFWDKLEPRKSEFDLDSVESAIEEAETRGLDLGFEIRAHSFGAQTLDRCSIPAWVLNDPKMGGLSGAHGAVRVTQGPGDYTWRTARWRPAVMNRIINLHLEVIGHVQGVECVKTIWPNESAIGKFYRPNEPDAADYSVAGMLTQFENFIDLTSAAVPGMQTMILNYISGGGNAELDRLYRKCADVGMPMGYVDARYPGKEGWAMYCHKLAGEGADGEKATLVQAFAEQAGDNFGSLTGYPDPLKGNRSLADWLDYVTIRCKNELCAVQHWTPSRTFGWKDIAALISNEDAPNYDWYQEWARAPNGTVNHGEADD